MANLLATPALWHIDFDAPPPSSWNGSQYVIAVGDGATASFQLLYNGAQPAEGDVITGSVFFTAAEPPEGQAVMVLYDTVASEVLNFIPVTYGQASTFSFDTDSYGGANWTANGGVVLLLQVMVETPDGFPAYFYGLQLALTPLVPPAPTVGPCDEIGRVSRAYVSAHDRTRVHSVVVPPGDRRCVVADYNGAIPVGRAIAAIEWRLQCQGVVAISNAAIPTTRQAQVQIQAGCPGRTALRCMATLDNGEVYVQRFMVEVPCMPSFGDEAVTSGPMVLTAVAS